MGHPSVISGPRASGSRVDEVNEHPLRLVASDLDGTLLGPDSVVSDRTAAALEATAASGVEVVVATGRSHWSSVRLLEHLGCIRWAICSNGATVYDFDAAEVVDQRPVSDEHVGEVVERVVQAFPTAGFAWESPEGIFHTERWAVNRAATDARFVAKNSRPTRELEIGVEPILKLMIAHDVMTEYEWLDAMRPHVPEGLSSSTSGAAFAEVTASDANKGAALRSLCDQLGIGRQATIAFGDHSNDLEMLGWVGTGYAMANANPRVLEAADAVAPHHAEDGVAQVLEGFLD